VPPNDERSSARTDPLAALRAGPPPTLTDRARAAIAGVPREARPWAIALVLVVVLAVVGTVFVFRSATSGGRAEGNGGDTGVLDLPFAGTAVTSPTTEVAAKLVVHAAGAVVNPGVYELPAGSRVGDLMTAAGGVGLDGDADRLNLAAPLADGERLYVPRQGEDPPAVAAPDQRAEPSPGTATAAPGPIDLNRATLEQLEQLPGIGPSIGQAIIDHRDRNGSFRSVDDLLEVRGIGPARHEQLRPLVKV
jgi:competence protein ComEA